MKCNLGVNLDLMNDDKSYTGKLLIINVAPLTVNISRAKSRTNEASTFAASRRPIRVKIRTTGMAHTVNNNVPWLGSVPKGMIANRMAAVTLNTARSVIRI